MRRSSRIRSGRRSSKATSRCRSGWPRRSPTCWCTIYNDHITSFFFDHYSHFALGVGERYWSADEGGGARKSAGRERSSAARRAHRQLHGRRRVRPVLLPEQGAGPRLLLADVAAGCRRRKATGPSRIVPLQCRRAATSRSRRRRASTSFGRSLRKAIESYPEDLKVVIVGTGGLSHQVHGERCGFNNTPWDMEFLERLEKDPEGLTKVTHRRVRDAGRHGRRRGRDVAADARRADEEGEEAPSDATTCRR